MIAGVSVNPVPTIAIPVALTMMSIGGSAMNFSVVAQGKVPRTLPLTLRVLPFEL